jgi:hypothetical protein
MTPPSSGLPQATATPADTTTTLSAAEGQPDDPEHHLARRRSPDLIVTLTWYTVSPGGTWHAIDTGIASLVGAGPDGAPLVEVREGGGLDNPAIVGSAGADGGTPETGGVSVTSRSRRAASTPSTWGIRTSMTTTSGLLVVRCVPSGPHIPGAGSGSGGVGPTE